MEFELILTHGLGQTSAAWNAVLPHLSDIGRVHTPELSEFIGGGTYGEMFSGFCGYIDGVLSGKGGQVYLCGLSLGAVLCLDYAAHYPERVAGLTLFAPQYKMPAFLLRVQSLIFRLMPEKQFSGSGLTKKQFLSLTGSMVHIDLTPSLDKIQCRTVIACGERDKANIKAARKLSRLLADSDFLTVGGAGHEANIDAPEKAANIINGALNTHSNSSI